MSQRFIIRKTEEADSAGLMNLLADTPQEGSILLNFERQPNYFWATLVGTSEPELWVLEDTEKHCIAGACSVGRRDVFINGERQSIRYGSDLRIHRDYQGGRALLRLFKRLHETLQDEYYQTVILEENKASLKTVGSGRLKVQPTYYEAGTFRTNMIELRRKEKHHPKTTIRRATDNDIALIQAFFDKHARTKQFYPCYDFSRIGQHDDYYRDINLNDIFLAFDNDELVGMTGLWDQKEFKQTRIAGYARWMQYLRPLYNIYVSLSGGLTLPPPGSLTSYTYLHATVIKDNRSDIFADLLAYARTELRDSQYDALVVGFDKTDPLQTATDKYKKVELFSRHFLASYGDDPMQELGRGKLMHLETARL